jgi:hypothetical protein
MKKFISVLTFLFLTACSAAPYLENYSPLSNQGILPLSTSNPYMGANMFLASEIEQSAYLLNFLKAKGAPTAIDIFSKNFRHPRMLLFYPRDREVYAADLVSKAEQREWIIRGPYGIERKDFSALARMENALIGEPVFMLQGREYRFYQAARHDSQSLSRPEVRPELPAVQKKQPSKAARPAAQRPPTSPVVASAPKQSVPPQPPQSLLPSDPREFRPGNKDQVAIIISRGWAERNADGDIIHIVRRSDETLAAVAKWYAGSETNAEEISKANSLTVETHLIPGSRIRVPLRIATNFKPMPLDYK